MSHADKDQDIPAMPPVSRTTDGPATGGDQPGTGRTDPATTDADEAEAEANAIGAGTDGSGSGSGATVERSPAWVRLWWTPLVLFAVLGLLAAGAGLRTLIDHPPGDSSVDVGFARDMSEHHSQAVQMAMLEFRRGGDAEIRSVAQDIALSQQHERGVMATWLSGWGRPPTSAQEPMAWMGGQHGSAGHGEHGGHGDHSGTAPSAAASPGGTSTTGPTGSSTEGGAGSVRMPGMATEAELARLAAASGRDLDVLFVTLMIRHHRGGVEMAQYAALHAEEDKVRALARAMALNQSKEINEMQRYLDRLGAPPA